MHLHVTKNPAKAKNKPLHSVLFYPSRTEWNREHELSHELSQYWKAFRHFGDMHNIETGIEWSSQSGPVLNLPIKLSLCVYLYVCVCMYMHMQYIYQKRGRDCWTVSKNHVCINSQVKSNLLSPLLLFASIIQLELKWYCSAFLYIWIITGWNSV